MSKPNRAHTVTTQTSLTYIASLADELETLYGTLPPSMSTLLDRILERAARRLPPEYRKNTEQALSFLHSRGFTIPGETPRKVKR